MNIEEMFKDIKIEKDDVVVFGCSYGPDSMALFKALLMLREKTPLKLVCAHVNHGKRKESEEEKVNLESFCFSNDVIFEYMKIEHYGDDNFHNEARNIRYNFFEELMMKYQAKYLMTAHHGDDLMETVLMRIVRGSSLQGYGGFKKLVYMDNYYIYRPLINYTKEDILAFNKKYNIPYAVDSSNNSSVYTRNRYRKVVLPFLKEEDASAHLKFLKFSNTLFDAFKYIHLETEKALTKVVSHDKLLIDPFLQLDPFIRKCVLEEMLREFYQDDLILIGDKHMELLLEVISSKRANMTVNLPNDVIVRKSYDTVAIERNTDEIDSYEIELSDYVKLPNNHVLKVVDEVVGNSNMITRLSSKDLALPLRVRTREYGDSFALKGGGHKKIKDIFIDKKIPLKERDLWPIVVDSKNRIVFLPGLKKSKFDKTKEEFYDIILKYE